MASNKHRAVWDWLQSCPYVGDLFFNAMTDKIGGTCLVPSEQLTEEYIDGSEKRNYNCALTRFQAFSGDPNDMANITAVTDLEELGDWVRKQVLTGNLPAFPEGCRITDIRVLPNESGYMVAQDFSQAKYMIQFQIEYIREAADGEDETEPGGGGTEEDEPNGEEPGGDEPGDTDPANNNETEE